MIKTESPEQDNPIPTTYRHISVAERNGVLLLRFVDLTRELETPGSFQETCREFRLLSTRHQDSVVVLDLEAQNVSSPELFICYLVRLDSEIKQVQGTLKLCNLSPLFAEELKLIRLNRMFSIYESLDDALLKRPDPR